MHSAAWIAAIYCDDHIKDTAIYIFLVQIQNFLIQSTLCLVLVQRMTTGSIAKELERRKKSSVDLVSIQRLHIHVSIPLPNGREVRKRTSIMRTGKRQKTGISHQAKNKQTRQR